MNRKSFLKTLTVLPLAGFTMKLNELNKITQGFSYTEKMPVLFLGHGNPMNAIEENEFTQSWQALGKKLPKPNAILCISAHWETKGTYVTAMEKPKTIHDFSGFPQALFNVQYPAPGSVVLANKTQQIITKTPVALDYSWGLDHGCWSVVKHLYPNANIPIIQMSLDYRQAAQHHYELAKELNSLRNKGILIIGSGNIVHNLRLVAWDKINTPNFAYDWAIEANNKIKELVLSNNYKSLINYAKLGVAVNLAVPSPEHFLPLLYILALQSNNETITVFNDKALMGSLTMTSFKIG